jgi:uncharacterized phage protein (TIGR01671 family)
MQETKFRLFDKRSKKMIYPKLDDLDMYSLQFIEDSWQVEFNNSEDEPKYYGNDVFEIMQYTGLRDINGKEIYEGDIVKHSIDGYEQAYSYHIHDMVDWFQDMYNADDYYRWDEDSIEIIGNIYENPER